MVRLAERAVLPLWRQVVTPERGREERGDAGIERH
jgi:hypothetical protein